ncbi:MAG: LysM peptidoglycan-binding domain-containing protein, partial [Actinomycetota bacterium]
YDVVRVDYPVDLRLVAECVDVPVEKLVDLNPSLLRGITPKNQPFDLHLPPGTRDKYVTDIAAIPVNKRVAWRYHKVESGETLAGIARKYHTTERAIEQVNNLKGKELFADAKLVIPVSAEESRMVYSGQSIRYRVRSGDTLFGIAHRFGVTVVRLRSWNHLKGNMLRPGRLLVVHESATGGEVRHVARHRRKKALHHVAKRTAKKQKKSSASESLAVNTR